MTIFDILRDVLKDKTGALEDEPSFEKSFNMYMIARYLSMRGDLMPYARFLNVHGRNLTARNAYRFLLESVPRTKNCFIQYIKKPKKKEDADETAAVDEDE